MTDKPEPKLTAQQALDDFLAFKERTLAEPCDSKIELLTRRYTLDLQEVTVRHAGAFEEDESITANDLEAIVMSAGIITLTHACIASIHARWGDDVGPWTEQDNERFAIEFVGSAMSLVMSRVLNEFGIEGEAKSGFLDELIASGELDRTLPHLEEAIKEARETRELKPEPETKKTIN